MSFRCKIDTSTENLHVQFKLCRHNYDQFYITELELRQAKGYIDKDVFLLAVEDPKADVGSGGATINALLTVAEYISAQRGFSVSNKTGDKFSVDQVFNLVFIFTTSKIHKSH